jgi:zinc protease
MRLLHDLTATLPYIRFMLVFPRGAVQDPHGLCGLTHLVTRLALRGAGGRSLLAFHRELDSLGSSLDIQVGARWTTVHGDCMPSTLPRFAALLRDLLGSPALEDSELDSLKSQHREALLGERENDEQLFSLFIPRHLFGTNAHANPTQGLESCVDRVTGQAARDLWAQTFRRRPAIAGVVGNITEAAALRALDQILEGFPEAAPTIFPEVPTPRLTEGSPRLLLVEKPGLTQIHAGFAALAPSATSPDYIPLHLANTAFGELFTGPLVAELRGRRGWCYSTDSIYSPWPGFGVQTVILATGATEGPKALALAHKLFRAQASKGLTEKELNFARLHLVRRHPFSLSNPFTRMKTQIRMLLSAREPSWLDEYQGRIEALTLPQVNEALQRHWLTCPLAALAVVPPASAARYNKALAPASLERVDWMHDWEA